MTKFDAIYRDIISQIMYYGVEERNVRTGHLTKALPGLTIELDSGFPLLTLRRISVKAFIAEQIWFLSGSQLPSESLRSFTKVWDSFMDSNDVIPGAYGYRWRQYFGRDQISNLVALLEEDPSSRQGVVIAWDPGSDGLNAMYPRKHVPCPYSFTVNIIGGKLHLHNVVRSNDMILGCPYDVAGFALLQRMLAARLGTDVGKYTHSISNAHIYDVHYEAAWSLIERNHNHPEIALNVPDTSLERAMQGDYSLVEELKAQLIPQYNPLPAVGRLEIVS